MQTRSEVFINEQQRLEEIRKRTPEERLLVLLRLIRVKRMFDRAELLPNK
jgi:hypothetical protein